MPWGERLKRRPEDEVRDLRELVRDMDTLAMKAYNAWPEPIETRVQAVYRELLEAD